VGWLVAPETDRETTTLVHDGEVLVGFVRIEDDQLGAQTYADVYTDPALRTREVADAGVALAIAAARGHRDTLDAPDWTLRAGCLESDAPLRETFLSHGLTHVRTFFRMRIDCSSPAIPQLAPPLPEGVTLRIARDEDDYRRLHLVDSEAFLDHWNFTSRPFEDWWEYFGGSPSLDPEGLWLLEVDGEPAGLVMLDESRAGFGDGYVAILGVRRAFRGRGLATLLLQRAFVHYRDLGRSGVSLGVDAESLTGAVRLYERVGMTRVRTIEGYALTLGADA
jgi:ribosomal protein S18 acetylase RimI-like enzyme